MAKSKHEKEYFNIRKSSFFKLFAIILLGIFMGFMELSIVFICELIPNYYDGVWGFREGIILFNIIFQLLIAIITIVLVSAIAIITIVLVSAYVEGEFDE